MTDSPKNEPLSGHERSQRDPRTTEVLVEAAIAEEMSDADACPALVALQARGAREVLEAALTLCSSPDRIRRLVGVRILGELGSPRSFPEECCDALLNLVRNDKDEGVFATAVFMFGHLRNRRCEPDLVALRHHVDPYIRYGVAFSLVGATSPAAVEALLELMEDSEPRARDWATTSIGETLSLDGPNIRDALLRRVEDDDAITRAEALHGLARRGDVRVIPFLIKNLQPETELVYLFEDAAKCFLGLEDDADKSNEELVAALQAALTQASS